MMSHYSELRQGHLLDVNFSHYHESLNDNIVYLSATRGPTRFYNMINGIPDGRRIWKMSDQGQS